MVLPRPIIKAIQRQGDRDAIRSDVERPCVHLIQVVLDVTRADRVQPRGHGPQVGGLGEISIVIIGFDFGHGG